MVSQTVDGTAAVLDGNAEVTTPEPLETAPTENSEVVTTAEAAPEVTTETVKPDYSSLLAEAPEDELLQTPRMRDIIARKEESIRQRTEAKLLRDAGSNENVRRVLSSALARAVETGDEVEYQKVAAQAIYWNRQSQLTDLAREFPAALLRSYDLPAEVLTKALEVRETAPPDQQWDGYMFTLIEGAVEQKLKETRKDDDARVKKAISDGVAAELRARTLESAQKLETPPNSPPPGGGRGGWLTQKQIDTAHANGELSNAEVRALRASGEYQLLPYELGQ